MKNPIVIAVIVAVVVGAGAFFAGMKYQQGKTPAVTANAGGTGGFGGRGGNGRNGANRPMMGQIISQDDKSMTVKMQDGSTKIVLLSTTTAINKAATATKSDITVGERVNVFGTANTDGSVTAQNIQLNPMMRPDASASAQPGAAQ